MDHVLLDPLEDGSLPLYDFGSTLYYQWQSPCWNIHVTDTPEGERVERPIQEGITYEVADPFAVMTRPRRAEWHPRQFNGRQTLINLDMDEPLTALVDTVYDRLAAIVPHRLETLDGETIVSVEDDSPALQGPGTLILAIRQVWALTEDLTPIRGLRDWTGAPVIDRHGLMVMGGLAYMPGVQRGRAMTAEQMPYYLEQACMGLGGRPYDIQVGAVQDLIVERIRARQRRAEERREVDARANGILLENLSPEQRAEFEAHKRFHVQGKDGFTYLITDKAIHNVFRVEGDRPTVEYCIVTALPVPHADVLLTQKLLLEADPETFHKATNAWELTEEDGKKIRRYLDPVTFEPHDVMDTEAVAEFVRRIVN